MNLFWRKVNGYYAFSTEYMDERLYRGQTRDEALKYFLAEFPIKYTKLIEMK